MDANANSGKDSDKGHIFGACFDCGEHGHHMGDEACKKPDAALNMPPHITRFLISRKRKGKRKRKNDNDDDNDDNNDTLKAILDRDEDNEVKKCNYEKRIALLEKNQRIMNDRMSKNEVVFEPVY